MLSLIKKGCTGFVVIMRQAAKIYVIGMPGSYCIEWSTIGII